MYHSMPFIALRTADVHINYQGIGPTRPWAPLNTDPIEFVFKVCMHLASNITMTILLVFIDFYFIKSNLTIWIYKGPYNGGKCGQVMNENWPYVQLF